jgi:hypothetical protein
MPYLAIQTACLSSVLALYTFRCISTFMERNLPSIATVLHTNRKMDEITQIVRDIGRQQAHNAYYRKCYSLLKHLQECVDRTSDDLLRLHQAGELVSYCDGVRPVNSIMDELRHSVLELIERARNAQTSCEMYCPVDANFSARDAFSFTDVDWHSSWKTEI